MLSANFRPKTTAAASRGFLATARLSCLKSQEERSKLKVRRNNSFGRMFDLSDKVTTGISNALTR